MRSGGDLAEFGKKNASQIMIFLPQKFLWGRKIKTPTNKTRNGQMDPQI